MRPVYPCPRCAKQFGGPVWRDNHAAACAKLNQPLTDKPAPEQRRRCVEGAKPPAPSPANGPDVRRFGGPRWPSRPPVFLDAGSHRIPQA